MTDVQPIWSQSEPGSGRIPRTRADIAAAALAIADADGLEAVSMRRVASELGMATMSLYHYVRGKDDVIDLMADAYVAEFLVPDAELAKGWRAGLTAIAMATKSAFERHPWALGAMRGSAPGPNGMRHFDQSLAAVSSLDIDDTMRFELIWMVDDYVIGFVVRELAIAERARGAGVSEDSWREALAEYVDQQLKSGDYPHVARVLGAHRESGRPDDELMQWAFRDDRFERGLRRLLDGIEADLARGDGAR